MTTSLKSSHTVAPLFFLLMFLSFRVRYCIGKSSISIVCPEVEKQSLLSFKQSLQDPSNLLSSWNIGSEVNCCKWEGVVCSNLTGHVHELHLQTRYLTSDLSGEINPSLLNLKHLKYLDLSENYFYETIFPSFIGSLTSLEYLNLSGAGFHGKIPNSIGNLSNLHTLVLENSGLYVDSLEWLPGLSKLVHLNMNYVNLSSATNWQEQVINILPSLVELHFREVGLKNITGPFSDVTNITTSNLAVLDLSNFLSIENSTVPKWIFQLKNLIYLDLNRNLFEGPIPTNTNITKLQHIDLYYNHFNSRVPDWIYSCKNLEYLDLSYNNLQDSISNSIANLTSLNTLDLSSNELSGGIPQEIGEYFNSLRTLHLSANSLSGLIPNSIGNLTSLQELDLSENSLSGVIPNSIGNLTSLQSLYLFENKLSGNLPESMGKLFNLKELSIAYNMLEGVVTEIHFANLSKLMNFCANVNHLTLKVGPNWIPPFKLSDLELQSWNLSSPIPSWLETQKNNIGIIDLSNTGIYGTVPSWLFSVGYVNLSCNQLHGKIPEIKSGNDFRYIFLGSNKFSGPLPRIGTSSGELDLSNNSFSGDLSLFLCNTTTNELLNLNLEGNHLTGQLPNCFMKWSSLSTLNLANNNISGTIPNSIGFLERLRSLNLFGNKLSGRIPFSMHNCTELVNINLHDNNLDGDIPEWIGKNLSKLTIFILRSNKLSGEITSAICQLSSLQILDLADNMFSGVIPSCVNNFTAMTTKPSLHSFDYSIFGKAFQESASIATKGRELTYDTTLALVTNIDLSNNNLSGDIPKEITSLVELRSLNLSRNHLTGLIPESIGNMKQLESLDFSRNSLSGKLPNSFSVMPSLSYMDLSYNNLTGRIPQSTQILGLTHSSFIGNNLCGPPLTSNCENDGITPVPSHTEDNGEEGDISENEWFYMFISLGYAIGFSAFLTIWILKKSWRDAVYEWFESMWDMVYVYFYVTWRRLTKPSPPSS